MGKFYKLIVQASVWVAILSMSILPACTGGFDEEIDDLKKRVTEIETALATLQQNIGEGLLVKDITALDPAGSGWLVTFSDGTDIEIANCGIEVRVNDDGSVTFIMNDEEGTELTFARASGAHSVEMLTDVMPFDGSESVEVLFRVNPSSAWVPTGTGAAIEKWALDQIGTRANYVNPAQAFSVTAIEPDGDKTGQYVATIAGDAFKHNPDVSEYLMALVLDTGVAQNTDDEESTLVSSGMFKVTQSGHRLTGSNSGGSIYFGDYWKNGTADFSLQFYNTDFNDPNAVGYIFTVDLTSEPIDDDYTIQYLRIPNGKYSFDRGTEAWQIYQGDIWEFPGDGTRNFITLYDGSLAGGSMTISGEGTFYSIVFDIEVAGGRSIVAKYDGDIFINNPYYWPYTGDIEVDFTQVILQETRDDRGYFGEYYGAGTSNFRWLFHDFDPSDTGWDGSGWELGIDLVSAAVNDNVYVETLDIPAGTYTFSGTGAAGTIVTGGNTWAVEVKNGGAGVMAPISGGTATISGTGSGYTMTFDIELENGKHFKASYEGAIVFPNPFGLPPIGDVPEPSNLTISRVSPVGGTVEWNNAGTEGWAFRIQGNLTTVTAGLTNEFVIFYNEIATPGFVLDGLLLPDETYTWQVANIQNGRRSEWVEGPAINTPPPGDGGDLGTFSGINQYRYTPNVYGDSSVDGWFISAYQSPGVSIEGTTPTGTGWVLEWVLHAPLNSGNFFIPRVYPFNSSLEMFTALPGQGYGRGGTTLTYIKDGAPQRSLNIASGTVNVAFAGATGFYTCTFDVMDSLGDKYLFKVEIDSTTTFPVTVQ